MYVVVMGCGRVGSAVATALVRLGHEVAVIDRDESAFGRLGPDFPGHTVLGMGFDRDVLISAGIVSTRVARETFGVERVVARIYDAKRAAAYERLGIPTVATVPWTTDRFLHALTHDSETARWRDPTGSVAIAEVNVHEGWVGRRVTELEEATGSRVAFLIRFGTGLLPDRRTVLQADDSVYIAAVSGSVSEAITHAENPPVDEN